MVELVFFRRYKKGYRKIVGTKMDLFVYKYKYNFQIQKIDPSLIDFFKIFFGISSWGHASWRTF